ncbi:MAG: histidine kinase [Polaromonas sp.]|nr:histidine kinase [Polaromonas sp.]
MSLSGHSTDDSAESIARDVAAVGAISAVPSILRMLCNTTGMGFSAVARVTEGTWTACAVEDNIRFGLTPGSQLPVNTTLCIEARTDKRPVVFDHASQDPVYRDHHTPRMYNIESYISVPILMPDGAYFGNLCAIDPMPHKVSAPQTVAVFEHFAELIGLQLDSERQREHVETELLTARATAELREHFIAVLGHDLKNPLSSVGMAGELLIRKSTDPEMVKVGERLRSTTRRMSRLIDDVLDLARGRLGAGIGVTIEEHGTVAVALQDVVAEMRQAHPDREIHSRITIDKAVRCDLGRVQQLLSNLLGNALAYGAKDEPVVVNADIEGEYLEIAVMNDGEPIPQEMQGKVFEPYWRPATSKPGGGLGLGLYICSQIAKAHDGGIKVTSSSEGGTTFIAQLRVS